MPKLDTTFVVICREDRPSEDAPPGRYVLATRRVFLTETKAGDYVKGISPSREPIVVPGDWLHLRETAVPDGDEPRFTHDCEHCVFLGRIMDETLARPCDLYFCPTNGSSGRPTVLARLGDEGPDYISGLLIADAVPALAEAKRRAKAKGLLP